MDSSISLLSRSSGMLMHEAGKIEAARNIRPPVAVVIIFFMSVVVLLCWFIS